MVFHSPKWVPQLPFDIPDSLSIGEFMQREDLRPVPAQQRRDPFTCGLTGKSYSQAEQHARSEHLATSLAQRHGWDAATGDPWNKVVCIFSLNSINYLTAAYAVHRLSGIVTPANAVYTVEELTRQLISSKARAVFTCQSLLETARLAADQASIPQEHVYLIEIPSEPAVPLRTHATLDQMIEHGRSIPQVRPVSFGRSQGARQTAFLCYSSGTSGQPKAVMISHYNVIANIVQMYAYESIGRAKKGVDAQVLLAPLPMSHIYALVVASHAAVWRGDGYVVLPKYDFRWFLEAIQRFRVQQILVVPPILIQMLRSKDVCARYDLSSMRFLFSGAAPLGKETIQDLSREFPRCTIAQAYGMTETAVCVSVPSEHDVEPRASGSLLPGTSIKIVDEGGQEVVQQDTPGEILVRAPSVVLGYMNNEKANSETFVEDADGRWVRTGDVGLITKVSSGNEQLVIVDRIKEMIKVMGHQVAPAELEAHLLAHPAVADCAVIQIPDAKAGEVPKAFVVRSSDAQQSDYNLVVELSKWVTDHKSPYKALRGGVEFMDAVPKSPSGKILRRELRVQEQEKGAKRLQAKL